MKPTLTLAELTQAAVNLTVPVAGVQAFAEVECPMPGFDLRDQPRVLFEGAKFSEATGGVYDKEYPTLSQPNWTREFYAKGPNADARNEKEHKRMQAAAVLNRPAALASASWGKFQIMGFNYKDAGFPSLQSFINAMYHSEGAHLDAYVSFIKKNRGGLVWKALKAACATNDWNKIAEMYNGSGYKLNNYHKKLADAFIKYSK